MTAQEKEQADTTMVSPQQRTRNTAQRKAVLDAVHALAGQHPTAADVFALVRRDHPQLSLATVYRALHALVAQGAVTEVRAENVARYDVGIANPSPAALPHHHLVCRVCGAVEDVSASAVPAALLRAVASAAGGFALDLHPVQFTGVCASCRAAKTAAPAAG